MNLANIGQNRLCSFADADVGDGLSDLLKSGYHRIGRSQIEVLGAVGCAVKQGCGIAARADMQEDAVDRDAFSLGRVANLVHTVIDIAILGGTFGRAIAPPAVLGVQFVRQDDDVAAGIRWHRAGAVGH